MAGGSNQIINFDAT